MSLKNSAMILSFALGIGLIGFSAYWYLLAHYDPSQFLAFTISGFEAIVIGLLFSELKAYDKFRGEFDYFENKMVETYPQLIKK